MGTINVLSLSYGKDSLACLGACEKLGWKIDRIIHAEVWATDEISADLPPMLEFKKKADAIIKERYGLEVEHICAMTTPNRKYGSFTKPLVGGGKEYLRKVVLLQSNKRKVHWTSQWIPMHHKRMVSLAQTTR